MGTYNSPRVSHDLVMMEGAAAGGAGIPYIPVSEQLSRFNDGYRSFEWLRKEDGHPGKASTLLEAILVYKQLYGTYPIAKTFVVHAPIYGIHSGLKPTFREANAPPPNAITPLTVSYSAAVMGKLLLSLNNSDANNSAQPTASSLRWSSAAEPKR